MARRYGRRNQLAGSIAATFGCNLGGSPGVTVKLNNITAPIFAASATQINFQVPWELAGQAQASLTVTTGGLTSTPVTVSLAPRLEFFQRMPRELARELF